MSEPSHDNFSGRGTEASRATEVELMIDRFRNTLPENARPYFVHCTSKSLHEVVSKLSAGERFAINLSALALFPLLFRSIYLNSTERVVVLIGGKHKILQGPGFHWVPANLYDKLYRTKYTAGQDIIQGPIKLLFVQPGTMKYVWDIQTSRPMLLSPGMHYFDDINIQCDPYGPEEIVLNSDNGDNKIIQFGQNGIFRFIFVKTGYKGIVATREGTLRILEPGLHFVEAPDSFRLFAHVQREHFSFGQDDVFLTADNVELNIEATLFYQIKDVAQVFTTSIKDEADMKDILLTQAKSTLMTIVRSENFAAIGRSKMANLLVNAANNNTPAINLSAPVAPNAPPLPDGIQNTIDAVATGFQSIMHDAEPQFRSTMQTTFGNTFGLEIIALRIEKIEFADKKMQKQVSESAIGYTTLAAQEATITQQMKLKRAEADRDAAKVMIEANAEANKNLIKVEAQSKAAVIEAEAKSRIAKINAEADANAEVCKMKTIAENNVYVSQKNAESLQIKANADAAAEVARLKTIADNNVYVSQKNAESLQIKTAAEANSKLLLAESEAKAKKLVGEAEVGILRSKNDLQISTVEIVANAQIETFKNTEKQIIYSQDAPFMMHKMNDILNKFGSGK